MLHELVAKNGLISIGNSKITGSLTVTGLIIGNLQGSASYATTSSHSDNSDASISASYAKTASVVLMSGNLDGGDPYTSYGGILFGDLDGGTPISVYGGVRISPIVGGIP